MSKPKVVIDGLPDINKLFEDVSKIANKTVSKAAREAVKIARKDARQRALKVKDTGLMARSLKYRIERSRVKGKRVYRLGFFGDGWYGRFFEYGTSKMPANPMLRPAVENNAEQLRKVMLKTLASEIDRVK